MPTGITPSSQFYFVVNKNAGAGTFEASLSSGGSPINTSGSQSGFHNVINATTPWQASVTTIGNPVSVSIIPTPTSLDLDSVFALVNNSGSTITSAGVIGNWYRNSTQINQFQILTPSLANGTSYQLPYAGYNFIDYQAPAGVNTYTLSFTNPSSGLTVSFENLQLIAYEL
jgi:hypothetical protein